MKTYIEREALLRALSKEVEYDDDGEQEINSDTVFITIEAAPAADVETVVHCGDCKFRCDFTDGHCECRRWPNIPMSYQRVDPQFDFCSYGKRKEAT